MPISNKMLPFDSENSTQICHS